MNIYFRNVPRRVGVARRREAAFQPLWDAESVDDQPLDVEAFVRAINGEPEPISPRELAAFVRAVNGEPEPVDPRSLAAFVAAINGRPDPNQQREFEEFVGLVTGVSEAVWDPTKHPRTNVPPNRAWFAKTGGSGATANTGASPSLFDAIVRRNQEIGRLAGVVTPNMIRANRLAVELESVARLPGEVARAITAGLDTGRKAVVNGFATAVKSAVTLGLSTSQLELIGVTKEDRARGYDTAVAISTASGQVLIAVGTGRITSALSQGGAIARSASGVLIAYDAAGNAVGVVQGTYDAIQNGVTVANGAQIAGGLLGLGANAKSIRDVGRASAARSLAEVDAFVAKCPRTATPTSTPAGGVLLVCCWVYNRLE